MNSIIPVCVFLAILAAGCGSTFENPEAEKRYKAFQAPDYSQSSAKPDLDNVGEFLRNASKYYHQGVAASRPIEKKRLLQAAAKNYELAITELKALRQNSRDSRRREELSLIIKSVEEDLHDCYRLMPITGE